MAVTTEGPEETRTGPEPIVPTYLAVKWTVSRGRDTYGYNICTIRDQETGKAFRCRGGGYDMLGTSLAEWMVATYPGRLLTISNRAYSAYLRDGETSTRVAGGADDCLYGMTSYPDKNCVSVDGACGEGSVQKIAQAIGLDLARTWDKKANTTGWIVTAAADR